MTFHVSDDCRAGLVTEHAVEVTGDSALVLLHRVPNGLE